PKRRELVKELVAAIARADKAERERDVADLLVDGWRSARDAVFGQYCDMVKERDDARAEVARLRKALRCGAMQLAQLADEVHRGDPVSSGNSAAIRNIGHSLARQALGKGGE